MLVLNRKKGESIIISDYIEIQIIDIQGDSIKLGIEAPREVRILRKELYEETIRANKEASQNLEELKEVVKKINRLSHKEKQENDS